MAGMHLGTPPAGHAAMVVKWHVHILLKSFTILNTCSITMWQRCPSFMFILILSHHIRGCVSQPEGQYLNVVISSSELHLIVSRNLSHSRDQVACVSIQIINSPTALNHAGELDPHSTTFLTWYIRQSLTQITCTIGNN